MLVLLGGILAERYVVTWHAVLAWFPRRTVGWPRRGVGATRWDCNWCCLCVYVCVLGADADARLKGFLEAAADCIYTIERSPTALEDLRSVGTMKTAPVQTVLVLEARVSGACSSPPARHLAGRPSYSSGAHHLGLLQAQVLLLWVARCPHPRVIFALQDRVGGRILSLPFGGSGGVAELGAQFIWGSESGMDSSSQAGASGGGRGNPITAVSLAEPCVRQAVSTC